MSTDNTDLERLDPDTAIELFLEHKAMDCADSTVQNHRYQLKHFLSWCDENKVVNLNELSGRDIQDYRIWIGENDDLNALTINNILSGFRVFLKWAASVEAVPENLYTKLMIPRVRRSERSSEDILETDRAEELLEYLSTYEYASIEHATLAVLWETGMRLGTIKSVDLGDIDFEAERLNVVHRPDQDTPLKNGTSGERLIALSSELVSVLEEYIDVNRHDVTDGCGREPLLTTTYGRMQRATIRRMIYRITAPCYQDKSCSDCAGPGDKKCPDAVGPHAIRRGSITHYLTEDVPIAVVGDRMDVSRDVLDEHYDKRSREVKLEQRRRYLEDV